MQRHTAKAPLAAFVCPSSCQARRRPHLGRRWPLDLVMVCSKCGSTLHNARSCTEVPNAGAASASKAGASSPSAGAGAVPAERPRVATRPSDDAAAPPKPTDIWDFLDKCPASSPVGVLTKQVIPWVDAILFEKLRRIFYVVLNSHSE